jgi:nucleotide-binding universal stress UspA family protein
MAHGPDGKLHVAADVIIRHILCPVDLSTAAAKALRYAAALSSALGAELTALFVEADAPGQSRDLTAFIAATVEPAAGVRSIQRRGEPINEILGTSAAWPHIGAQDCSVFCSESTRRIRQERDVLRFWLIMAP